MVGRSGWRNYNDKVSLAKGFLTFAEHVLSVVVVSGMNSLPNDVINHFIHSKVVFFNVVRLFFRNRQINDILRYGLWCHGGAVNNARDHTACFRRMDAVIFRP